MPVIEGTGGVLMQSYGIFRTSGTPAGLDNIALPGALAIDVTSATERLFINTGTLAANVWTVVGAQV